MYNIPVPVRLKQCCGSKSQFAARSYHRWKALTLPILTIYILVAIGQCQKSVEWFDVITCEIELCHLK
jgi:hypothetical protein